MSKIVDSFKAFHAIKLFETTFAYLKLDVVHTLFLSLKVSINAVQPRRILLELHNFMILKMYSFF